MKTDSCVVKFPAKNMMMRIFLHITEHEAATADLGVVVGSGDTYAEVVGSSFLTAEGQAVATMGFGHEGCLYTAKMVVAIPVDGP